jgi:hypothetical protein
MTIELKSEYKKLEDLISKAIDKASFIESEMGAKTINYQEVVNIYEDLANAMARLNALL